MKIINLISGPRNLSTALMYSFAERKDTIVLDEPFYAYYLSHAKVTVAHPGEAAILKSLPHSKVSVIRLINAAKTDIRFVKGMAHHILETEPTFLLPWSNIILIRHPEKLLASFSKVIENPSITDIGIKKASEIFQFLQLHGHTPLVIDSDELLKNPSRYLKKMCKHLEIPFSEAMLSWDPGGNPADGVWASHWYKNVHNSSSFEVQKSSSQKMPAHLQPVLDEALTYYTVLKNNILIND